MIDMNIVQDMRDKLYFGLLTRRSGEMFYETLVLPTSPPLDKLFFAPLSQTAVTVVTTVPQCIVFYVDCKLQQTSGTIFSTIFYPPLET